MTHRVEPNAKGVVVRQAVTVKRKLVPVRRLKSVTVHTKREPIRISVDERMQEDRFAHAEELYYFWAQKFEANLGIAYVPKSKPADLGHLDDILDDIKDPVKIRRMMMLLITHKELAWVAQKNLAWLAKARNRTFIAPLMLKTTRTAEFSGQRTQTTKITFRGS